MKILVISGFLGAGKTTFIKELIKKTERDFCILENEFGAINIDSTDLKESNDKLNIYELTEGCICCSSKGEFASSVLSIANTIDPDYLIIEPTGVGYLSSILKNLKKVAYEKIEIIEPITIVDGQYILNHPSFNECLVDQIENSNCIFISKLENYDKEDKELVYKKIKEINKNANVYIEHYSTFNKEFFFNLLMSENEINIKEKNLNINRLEEFGLKDFVIHNELTLITLLEDITRGLYGNIIRAKGYAKLDSRTLRFDLVDQIYNITESDFKDSEVVFIGKNIDKTNIRKVLFFD